MSAHCNTCGDDIVYPEGTWPLGLCARCKATNERDIALGALHAIEEIISGYVGREPWGIVYRDGGRGESGLKQIAVRCIRVIEGNTKQYVEDLDSVIEEGERES